MRAFRRSFAWMALMSAWACLPIARGQEPGKDEEFLPVQQIITQAVRNITIRYSLNAEQQELTDQLMRREVHKFLREHQEAVWPVLRDLMRYQASGETPPPDAAKRIASAAQPLLGLAFEAIFKGNEEWRECLTKDQKRTHDWDMQQMRKTFDQITENLDDWKSGTPKNGGLFPPPPSMASQPPKPKKPAPGLPRPPIVTPNSGLFEGLVKQFIEENDLDPTQRSAARSILDEVKHHADAYVDGKKDAFAEVQEARVKARRPPVNLDEIRKADLARRELLKPIIAMTDELTARLVKLLRTEQLVRYCQRHPERAADCALAARIQETKGGDAKKGAKVTTDRKTADSNGGRSKGRRSKKHKAEKPTAPDPGPAGNSTDGRG